MPIIKFTTKVASEALSAQEKLNTSAGKLDDIYKKDTRAAKDLQRAAVSIYKSLLTPQQQMLEN